MKSWEGFSYGSVYLKRFWKSLIKILKPFKINTNPVKFKFLIFNRDY